MEPFDYQFDLAYIHVQLSLVFLSRLLVVWSLELSKVKDDYSCSRVATTTSTYAIVAR